MTESLDEEGGATPPSSPKLTNAHSADQQAVIDYAWEITHDKRFIKLLTAENGLFTFKRRHDPALNAAGVDWGLCGMNDYWHNDIVSDPRFLTDREWQTRKCYEEYTGGTTFYGIIRYDNNPWIAREQAYYRDLIHAKFINL